MLLLDNLCFISEMNLNLAFLMECILFVSFLLNVMSLRFKPVPSHLHVCNVCWGRVVFVCWIVFVSMWRHVPVLIVVRFCCFSGSGCGYV